ncbi:MAG: cytochrome c [bacterium]
MKKHFTLLISLLFLFALAIQAQLNNPWVVPDEYKEMVNPTENNKSSMKIAKSLYSKHCETCHGKKGLGDGDTSPKLNTDPSNLTLIDLDVQTDGELFYKILTGRDEMPAYENKIPEADIWLLVNYIRTFYHED